jgi:hypothetical protein
LAKFNPILKKKYQYLEYKPMVESS